MTIIAPLRVPWSLIRDAEKSWCDDDAPSMGAALAYYSLFSMAPLLLIAIALAGLVFGAEAARGEILAQLQGIMGVDGARAVQNLLVGVGQPREGLLASVIGALGLALGALGVLSELRGALDRIWHVPDPGPGGFWRFTRRNTLLVAMVIDLGLLLVISLVASTGLAAIGRWWSGSLGGWEEVAGSLNVAISFVIVTVIFAAIYKIVPRVDLGWRDVWIGAIVTAVLFTLGKVLIALYLGIVGVGSGLGAAGSLAALLVWLYYSAQIFLLGAEFTWVYAHRYGTMARRAKSANGSPDVKPPGFDEVKALTFDVFGTVVDWRSGLVRDLGAVFAAKGFGADPAAIADAWYAEYTPATAAVRQGHRSWVTFDVLQRENLERVLGRFGLDGFSTAEIADLAHAWRRLDPWPDVLPGLARLQPNYALATLSNGNVALMVAMAKRSGLAWDAILGAEFTQAYKPDPKIYLGTAAALGLAPSQCLMVAAHEDDLAAAGALGFRTALIVRPHERGPAQVGAAVPTGRWDLAAHGFVDLADQLGC